MFTQIFSNLSGIKMQLYFPILSGASDFPLSLDTSKCTRLSIETIIIDSGVNAYVYFGEVNDNNYIEVRDIVASKAYDISSYDVVRFRVVGSSTHGHVYLDGVAFK